MSLRRRRRVLAAPFVLTMGAASACTVKPAAPETPAPTRYDQNGDEVTVKPVAGQGPAANTSGTATEPAGSDGDTKPRLVTNPPAPGTLPDAPTDGKGAVRTHEDGTCWYYVKIDCPPKALCNPPAPTQVKCPTTD